VKKRSQDGEDESAIVFTTKYALTAGIEKVLVGFSDDGVYAYHRERYGSLGTQYPPKTWHRTEAEAMARVAEMIKAKEKALARAAKKLSDQAAALRAGRFKVVDRTLTEEKTG